jgi:hypothetical protein
MRVGSPRAGLSGSSVVAATSRCGVPTLRSKRRESFSSSPASALVLVTSRAPANVAPRGATATARIATPHAPPLRTAGCGQPWRVPSASDPVAGPPERKRARIRGLLSPNPKIDQATGLTHLVGEFGYGGMPNEEAQLNLRLFADRVLPTLQRDAGFAGPRLADSEAPGPTLPPASSRPRRRHPTGRRGRSRVRRRSSRRA